MSDQAYFVQILVSGFSVGCIYGLIGIGFASFTTRAAS